MKESQYDQLFIRAVKNSGTTGISAPELHEKVGSSRQAAYQWVAKNKSHLRAAGTNSLGAQRYIWRDVNAPASADEVEIGTVFTVTRIRHKQGKIVAILETESGLAIEATLS